MSLLHKDIYLFGDFELHPAARSFLRLGEKVPLAPKTFDVLTCLVANAGRVVLKDEILKAVWPGSFVEESNLTQHIFWLRKALADKASYIVTIPGRGYQFTAPVNLRSQHEVQSEAHSQTFTLNGSSLRLQHLSERTHIVFEETTTIAPPLTLPARLRSRGQIRRPISTRLTVILSISLLLIAAALWGLLRWRNRIVPGDHHQVVLADFQNSTADPAFDRSLNTLLAIDLSQSPYLVVAPDSDIQKALELMRRSASAPLTPALAREVCLRLNDQAVLSGMIARFGARYLVTLAATDCQTGQALVSSKATADDRESVLKAVDTLASDMRRGLGESLHAHPSSADPLPLVHTFSLDALRAYSQARALEFAGQQRESIPLFQRAIDLDPKFAAACLWLAIAYGSVGEEASSRAAITRAYELRDQGDDFLKLNITNEYNIIVTGDLRAQQRNLLTWTQLYPNQPQPWIDLADNFNALGQFQQAVAPARRAVALGPNYRKSYGTLCHSLLNSGFVDDAKATCREAVRRHLDTNFTHEVLRSIAYLQHDEASWATEVAWVKTTDEAATYPVLMLFSEGKAHAAVALSLQRVALSREQGLTERAYIRESALLHRESDFQMDADLQTLLLHHGPQPWPFDRILADCELGRLADADADLKIFTSLIKGAQSTASHLPDFSHNTIQTEFYYPQALAHIALARHHPEDAIAGLEITHPLDDTTTEAILLRGRAYLAARQPALAEAEFRKIQDRPYLAIGMPFHPLAQLGLARALAAQRKLPAARQAYETLFTLWKDSDPDLRPLLDARHEYAQLK